MVPFHYTDYSHLVGCQARKGYSIDNPPEFCHMAVRQQTSIILRSSLSFQEIGTLFTPPLGGNEIQYISTTPTGLALGKDSLSDYIQIYPPIFHSRGVSTS